MLAPNAYINRDVDEHHERAEQDLNRPRQPGGIDQHNQIVLDETAAVAILTRQLPQHLLDGRQWADPARDDDHRRPARRRQMQPDQPSPAQNKKATGQGKQDERRMQYQDGFRCDGVEHFSCP